MPPGCDPMFRTSVPMIVMRVRKLTTTCAHSIATELLAGYRLALALPTGLPAPPARIVHGLYTCKTTLRTRSTQVSCLCTT
jgi:hypothetical protein